MRRALLVCLMLLTAALAHADMVEIKGEGFINGTIESENETEIVFKGAKGDVRTLSRKDVLFMERQAEMPLSKKLALKTEGVIKRIAPPAAAGKAADPKQKAKSGNSASSGTPGGGVAAEALRAMAKAQSNAVRVQRQAEKALREAEGGYGDETLLKPDARKGKFGSLSSESDFGPSQKSKKE